MGARVLVASLRMGRLSEQTPPCVLAPQRLTGPLARGVLESGAPAPAAGSEGRLRLTRGEDRLVSVSGSVCPLGVPHGALSSLVFVAREPGRGWGLGSCLPPDRRDTWTWGFVLLGVFEPKENDRVWQPGANRSRCWGGGWSRDTTAGCKER